jgi:uncharacterized Zn finger protein
MATLYCPVCANPHLTQEGLTALAIKYGYYRCLDCGNLRRPLVMPDSVNEDTK